MPDTLRWSAMDARARDALVAEKVMGLDVERDGVTRDLRIDHVIRGTNRRILPYTTDMNAAWQVVESHKFMDVKLEYTEGWHSDTERWQAYTCTVSPYDKPGVVSASWNTMPEAICIAALRAIGVTIEE